MNPTVGAPISARRHVSENQGRRRQVREGAEGSSGCRHPGQDHEGEGDAELHRGEGARSGRERGRLEGRALSPRGIIFFFFVFVDDLEIGIYFGS